MPVSISPFSDGPSEGNPFAPVNTNPIDKNNAFQNMQLISEVGKIKGAGYTFKPEEQRQLDTSYRSALAKISVSKLSDDAKKREKKRLEEIYTTGSSTTQKDSGLFSKVKNIGLTAVGAPMHLSLIHI